MLLVPQAVSFLLVMCCMRNASGNPIRRRLGIRRVASSSNSGKLSANYLDQAVEASSFVSDYEPQPGNLLLPNRLALPPYAYPRLYAFPSGDSGNRDVPEGVVTLGESRSYSVVKNTRRVEPMSTETNTPPEAQSTIPTTAEAATTTESSVTTDLENLDIATTEVQPQAIYNLENYHFSNSIKTNPLTAEEARHLPPTTEDNTYLPVSHSFVSNPGTSESSYSQVSSTSRLGSVVSYGASGVDDSRATIYKATPTSIPREPVTETSPTSQAQVLKHETRVETVSFHEEVVVPQKTEAPQNEKLFEVDSQKSYQFTNVQDQSYHHVKVTHLDVKDRQKSLPLSQNSAQKYSRSEKFYGMPEENYEVDEAVSVQTNGRTHGVQPSATDKNKFGYVVEGRNFKKYRVEERTPDGFIVGEYGVVRREDGSLRGVRYTADSTINPKLIYDTLIKFLSL